LSLLQGALLLYCGKYLFVGIHQVRRRAHFRRMKTQENSLLTKRELEIVRLLAQGHTSKSIGEALQISLLTVQTHRRNILCRLELKTASEVVAWAYQKKIL
jgi:DNA-binding NarL/FixJ family response regulator